MFIFDAGERMLVYPLLCTCMPTNRLLGTLNRLQELSLGEQTAQQTIACCHTEVM